MLYPPFSICLAKPAFWLPGRATAPKAAEVETVNDAWKHMKVVVSNDGKSSDLYDLLAQSGKDTIDPMPAGVSILLLNRYEAVK